MAEKHDAMVPPAHRLQVDIAHRASMAYTINGSQGRTPTRQRKHQAGKGVVNSSGSPANAKMTGGELLPHTPAHSTFTYPDCSHCSHQAGCGLRAIKASRSAIHSYSHTGTHTSATTKAIPTEHLYTPCHPPANHTVLPLKDVKWLWRLCYSAAWCAPQRCMLGTQATKP